MERKVTSYNFFKVGNHWEYIKDCKIYIIEDEMMECLLSQYKMQGFRVIFNNTAFLSVARVDNEMECFLEALRK